jgi:hypothetical protein
MITTESTTTSITTIMASELRRKSKGYSLIVTKGIYHWFGWNGGYWKNNFEQKDIPFVP